MSYLEIGPGLTRGIVKKYRFVNLILEVEF